MLRKLVCFLVASSVAALVPPSHSIPRRRSVVVNVEKFFPPPEKGKELQQAARNLALWSVILIGPEAAYRLPTYSACVADDLPRQTCADILPLVDWAAHLVG